MQFAQPVETRPDRPPNYLVRAIILTVILLPFSLLIGLSAVVTMWNILNGPSYRSESPYWMDALMEFFRIVVAVIAFFTPIRALVQARKVNAEYEAGNFGGAAKASKSAASSCRNSIIYIFLLLLIMAVDLLRFLADD